MHCNAKRRDKERIARQYGFDLCHLFNDAIHSREQTGATHEIDPFDIVALDILSHDAGNFFHDGSNDLK